MKECSLPSENEPRTQLQRHRYLSSVSTSKPPGRIRELQHVSTMAPSGYTGLDGTFPTRRRLRGLICILFKRTLCRLTGSGYLAGYYEIIQNPNLACLGGAGLLAVGIWVTADGSSFLKFVGPYSTQVMQFVNVGYFCIAVGAVLVILGFLGCCGALRESKCLLLIAESVLKALVLPELKSKYGNDNEVTKIWNATMTELKCCGFNNYTDFNDSTFMQQYKSYPTFCCKKNQTGDCTLNKVSSAKIPPIELQMLPEEVALIKNACVLSSDLVNSLLDWQMTLSKLVLVQDVPTFYKDLSTMISQEGVLEEPLARQIFRQVVEAINFFNGHGVFYQELHPWNVLVNGATRHVRLSVFGFRAVYRLTKSIRLTGSQFHPQAEAVKKRKERDFPAMVRMLGEILCFMTYGFLPTPHCGLTRPYFRRGTRNVSEGERACPPCGPLFVGGLRQLTHFCLLIAELDFLIYLCLQRKLDFRPSLRTILNASWMRMQ
ncbi:TSN1 protein, partial [Polypterus senegalus]